MAKLLKKLSILAAILATVPFLGTVPLNVQAAAASTAALTPAQQLAKLSLQQRVGQLFMVAATATGASSATMSDLTSYHVGNVYLSGRTYAGVAATAAVVKHLTSTVSAATTGGIPLEVATDQEGGYVQVLNGPGFSVIPTALAQGNLTTVTLQADAKVWGAQLKAAGLSVDLAPVVDTVPSAAFAPYNIPIGYYEREYGYTPGKIAGYGEAFLTGMRLAGIQATAKHFPGLGRVTANTDTSQNVTDTATTINDPYLLPFHAAINDGIRWVMISNAYYSKIDPTHIGTMSSIIMRTMLRTNAKFTGVVVSDDLCSAEQLSKWNEGVRAADFINTGGTMVLCANPANIPAMYNYVLNVAEHSPSFLAEVNAAVLVDLTVKDGH